LHLRNKMLHIVPVANNPRPVTIAIAQPVANNIRMNRHIHVGTINKRRRQSLKARNITSITFATSARLPLKLQPLHKHLINRLNLPRSEEHTSELQSRFDLVCRLLLEKNNTTQKLTR